MGLIPSSLPPSPLRSDLRSGWMLGESTFLNHGSYGAVPRVVFEAQTRWREKIEADPIEIIGRRSAELIAAARIPVGEQFGMSPSNFGVVTNATEGVNTILRSLSLQPGEELLTTNHVYHAIRLAMRFTARPAGAMVREIQIPLPVASSSQICDLVLSAISPQTRLLVIDHVTSPSGLVFPVQEIIAGCRQKNVDVLVDGAHAPGMFQLDIEQMGATYYTGNLHKWVCAPKGSAFLWVAPDRQSHIHPTVISHNLDQGFTQEFAQQGTRDLSAWLSVPAALEFMADLGWDKVIDHNHRMAVWAHQLLLDQWNVTPISPTDGSLLGSMATIPLPGALANLNGEDIQKLQQRLHDQYQIEVPLVGFAGRQMLRVSCQVYNQPSEYHRLVEVIKSIAM